MARPESWGQEFFLREGKYFLLGKGWHVFWGHKKYFNILKKNKNKKLMFS